MLVEKVMLARSMTFLAVKRAASINQLLFVFIPFLEVQSLASFSDYVELGF